MCNFDEQYKTKSGINTSVTNLRESDGVNIIISYFITTDHGIQDIFSLNTYWAVREYINVYE